MDHPLSRLLPGGRLPSGSPVVAEVATGRLAFPYDDAARPPLPDLLGPGPACR